MELGVGSKWQTEEIWRESLGLQRSYLRDAEKVARSLPAWVKEVEAARRRVERIGVAGLPEWQERDNAKRA